MKRRRTRAKAAGKKGKQVSQCCLLAAPTGCASFQMKYGATTAHRAFSIPAVGAFRRMGRQGERFRKKQAGLLNSRLIVLDERSMLGRMFVGKIVSRVEEFLGQGFGPPGTSLGGRDLLLIGDDKQIAPIGDEPLYQEGGYTGRSKGAEDGP